jgi:hypothetical protein
MVGLLGGVSALLQGRYLHRTTKTEGTQTSKSRRGFEPMIPVLERTKKFHTLDSATTTLFIYVEAQSI